MTDPIIQSKHRTLGWILFYIIPILFTDNIVYSQDKNHKEFFPSGDLYPRYIADPRRPQNSVMAVSLSQSDIREGGHSRYLLALGGRFGLVKFHQPENPFRGLEISLEAGFLAAFNRRAGLDNNGWDGLYGLVCAYRPNKCWAFKIASQHDSSHIGDEYIENTNIKRIHYTREELAFGVSRQASPEMLTYAEMGMAYRRNCKDQEPVRIQGGAELLGPLNLFNHSSGLYGAVDMVSWEENDWDISLTIQTGIRVMNSKYGKKWRFGIQYYNGRSHIGEFFQCNESYLGVGTWIDI